MAKEKEYKAVIPLSDSFIQDKKINDILYGWLQEHSYFDLDSKVRIIDKKNIKFSIMESELNITRKTLSTDFKYLIDNDYLIFNEINGNYVIKEIKGRFSLIGHTQLSHMVMSNYKNVIKIYCLLKAYYDMNKQDSFFTQTILLDKIGYNSRTTSNHKMIKNIIDWLVNNKYLEYECIGNGIQIKHFIKKIS